MNAGKRSAGWPCAGDDPLIQGQEDSTTQHSGGIDQRAAPRIALMLRVGKLRMAQGEFLCVVRDASASGIKLKLFHPLPEQGRCELELGTGDRYELDFVWERDGHAGFAFRRGAIDLGDLISETAPHRRRHLRLRFDRPVTFIQDGEPRQATLCDLSQHGAMIDYGERLPLGLALALEGDGLPALEGRVRWRLGRAHGLVFQRSFRLDELAMLAASLQGMR